MPTYVYECDKCGRIGEITCKIADRPEPYVCGFPNRPVRCAGMMRQVITPVTIKCDDTVNVPWIRRAMDYLAPDGHNVDTREKYQQYLDGRNLRPADGHNLSEV